MSVYYITKYALSSGILEVSHKDFRRTEYGIYGKNPGDSLPTSYHSKEWHESKADAIARAEEMRLAKIASVKKQLAKLEKMDFTKEPKE